MTPNTLPARKRMLPIERFAGVAPQFERTDGGYFFRRDRCGPAIRVTAAERDAFAAAGMRSLWLHVAAFGIFALTAWLLLDRLLINWSENGLAALFGIVVSLIAIALYGSLRWHADAPARALAGRPHERPARDPDVADLPGYGTIIGLTMLLLFLAAIGTRQPTSFYVAFASGSVMLGIFLATRTWWTRAGLTPDQRRRAAAIKAQARANERARARANKTSRWQVLLLIVFFVLELIAIGVGIAMGVGIVVAVTGVGTDDLSFGPFMTGFLLGMVIAGLLIWPLEKLCKRWTGDSALNSFDFIPAGW